MKFLFVSSVRDNGGAQIHFVELCLALADAGHVVEAIVYPDSPIAGALDATAVRVHPAPFRNSVDPRGYWATIKAARRLRPDWLISNFGKEYWPLLVLGRLLNVSVALFRHTAKPMRSRSAKWVPRLAQRFFAVSAYARDEYVKQGASAEHIHVLYNPVDTRVYQPDVTQRTRIRQQLGLDERAIVVGFVGRMVAGKGIFTLLEASNAAMVEEPRLNCLWLGDGPDLPQLRELIAGHPLAGHHHIVGWREELCPYYNAMDMLALPSKIPETYGRVLVEAQACAVPVLGSDAAGMREALLPGVTGWLLPPGDVTAWRDAILRLCDPALRNTMGPAGREFVQDFSSTPVIIERFLQLLKETEV